MLNNLERKIDFKMKCEILGIKSIFYFRNFFVEGFLSLRSMGECDFLGFNINE